MMKLAIITHGFTGSTLPLIKALVNRGIKVDLYITERSAVMGCREAFNIGPAPLKRNSITEVDHQYWPDIQNYMESEDFRLFGVRLIRPFNRIPILRNIVGVLRDFYMRKAIRQINDKNYDYVYIIAQYWDDDFLKMLKVIDCPKAIALHEVVNHNRKNYKQTPNLIKHCFDGRIKIVVFSENSYFDLLQYKEANDAYVHIIPFGIFETFSLCGNEINMNLPEQYILFYGAIKPYKGLDILFNAISLIPPEEMKGVKILVAGAGDDSYIENIKSDERFVLIHRYLLNDEIPYLIRKSMAVVCPYHSISQSGIPQTVYSFTKPLIASDLPAFRDVIDDGINGFLFKKDNPQDLAKKIRIIIDNPVILASLCNGVANFSKTHYKYSWTNIADEFMNNVFNH